MSFVLLEDDGGSGTATGHWEKKFFGNELMTGIMTGNPVTSYVTLGLMEDSGWYQVNYDTANILYWGKD